ncbi:hypothetical protein D3C75_982870 [compost metagenome]
MNCLQIFQLLLRLHRFGQQQLSEAEDARQRGPQLMADRADQLRLHQIQLIFTGDVAVDEQRPEAGLPTVYRYGVHVDMLQ